MIFNKFYIREILEKVVSMNKKVPEIIESVEDLKSILNTTKNVIQKDRIPMLYLLKSSDVKNCKGVNYILGM